MFKIGDLVEVHNPDSGYKQYLGKIGTIHSKQASLTQAKPYNFVIFSESKFDGDSFNDWEIRPAKNRIILDILNDL